MFVFYHFAWSNLLLVVVCFILNVNIYFLEWKNTANQLPKATDGLMSPSNTLIKEEEVSLAENRMKVGFKRTL